MDKKIFNEKFLIVNYHISKKENELVGHGPRTIDPITQNLTTTFNSNIYVKFIPAHVTEEELRKQFEFEDEDGKIVSIKLNKVNYGSTEYKSQYAYILYKGTPGAQRAIQRFDGQYLFNSTKPLSIEMWVSKEEKEQEKKRKEDRQTKQVIQALLGLPSYSSGPRLQNQGGNQGGYRGQGNQRGGRDRGNRGGNRGGQRSHGSRGPHHHGQGQQAYPVAQLPPLPLPQINIADLEKITGVEERKNFVGNAIYPIIE